MIKAMIVSDSADLQIYMDRFASSFVPPSSSKMSENSSSDDDDDDEDDDRDDSKAQKDPYYHFRSVMNEVYSMAYSLKVLISNISDWTIALRRGDYRGISNEDEIIRTGVNNDDDNDNDNGGDSMLGGKAVGKSRQIPLPINSTNVHECLRIVKSLVCSGKSNIKSSTPKKNSSISISSSSNSKSNKSNGSNNSNSSSSSSKLSSLAAQSRMQDDDPGNDDSSGDDDDGDGGAVNVGVSSKKIKKRKRKRGSKA